MFSALGAGGAMVFTPVYVIVGQYFDKKKGKAMGFSTLGSGLGNVVLAPLISLSIDHYGFFGATLFLGALQLHHIISALLYVPLSQMSRLKPACVQADKQLEVCAGQNEKDEQSLNDQNLSYQEQEKKAMKSERNEMPTSALKCDADSIGDAEVSYEKSRSESGHALSDAEINVKLDGKGDTYILNESTKSENAEHTKPEPQYTITTIPQNSSKEDNPSLLPKQNVAAADSSSYNLCCNWTFLVYGVVIMCLQANIQTFLIFLPALSKEYGATDTKAAFVLSIMGFADMAGRFISGFIFDVKPLRRRRRFIYCINCVVFGLAVFTMAFMPGYIAIATMTAITGKSSLYLPQRTKL